MAYRYEKNPGNGQFDLVIDGWEKGIAASPFQGIGNIRNLTVKYYEGIAYMAYKRQACTISGGTLGNPLYATQSPAGIIYISDDNQQIFKQTAANGSTFSLLTGNTAQSIGGLAFWNNYLFAIGKSISGFIDICGDGTGDAGVTSSNWNTSIPTTTFTVTLATPAVFTANNHGLSAGDNLRFTTTGALPTGLSVSTNYYVISAGLTANDFEVSATIGGSAVNTSGSQSGVQSYTVARGVWPIKNLTNISLTAAAAAGATSGTISSCPDSAGISRAIWNQPSGQYHGTFSSVDGTASQTVLVDLTQGSGAVTWTPALNKASTATLLTSYNGNDRTTPGGDSVLHQSIIAANDGNLYFCNNANIASFRLNSNQTFDKNNMLTFSFSTSVVALPPTETSVWLTELQSQLVILGKYRMYSWDFFSPSWTNPVPIDETMVKAINILNKLYIFAGNKGNIYTSNGYSIDRYAKLPDFVAGVIDPAWLTGGIMQHRQKLYFQALARNSATGAAILAGVFSLDLDTGALIMDNQNSGGLTPTGITQGGLLIDDSSTSINYDKYYSAFSATTPSIDFNDTTLYSSNEAVIETDIVPIGTYFQPKTFTSAEFKFDQPMRSGDSISLYARQSLSDSYTLIGTTSTAVLSNGFSAIPFEKWQWVQFKITMSCNATATSSSFNRLREVRIR